MGSINWADLKQAAGEAGFEPLPPGEYDSFVETATAKDSQNGKPMIVARFKVESGPYTGRSVFNNFVISRDNANALAFFFRHMRALGLDDVFFSNSPSMEVVASSLINKRCRVRLSIRQYNGEDRNQVDGILPPADGNPNGSPSLPSPGGMDVFSAKPSSSAPPNLPF